MDRRNVSGGRVLGRREMSMRSTANKPISRHQHIRVNVPEIRHTKTPSFSQEYSYADGRCVSEMSISPPLRTSGVMGRREQRMMLKKQVSDNWDNASVDSGHCSEFSSRSSESGSTMSSYSSTSSFDDMDSKSYDTSNIYAVVDDETKLDNTYASIHSCDMNSPRRDLPPKLPPRNNRRPQFNQTDSMSSLEYSNVTTTSTTSSGVIINSKYHTYTVDDIVDSYISLVNSIPKDVPLSPARPQISRIQSMNVRKQRDSPLRRSRSNVSSALKLKYTYIVDTDEVYL